MLNSDELVELAIFERHFRDLDRKYFKDNDIIAVMTYFRERIKTLKDKREVA